MHPDLDMGVSIDYQLKKLIQLYKPFVTAIQKAENKREDLFRVLLDAQYQEYETKLHKTVMGGGWCIDDFLASIFLLQKNYRLAWLCKVYLCLNWNRYLKRDPPDGTNPDDFPVWVDEPYLSDMRLMWVVYDSEKYVIENDPYCGRYRKNNDPKTLGAVASPSNEVLNEKELADQYQKATIQFSKFSYITEDYPDPTLLFNTVPKARYAKEYGVREFHLSYESLTNSIPQYIEVLLANERNLEAAEYLFRFRHIISRRNPPKVDECSPRLIQVASMANCLDCWLLARLSENPRQRQTLGWMAVYWLLENLRAAPAKTSDWSFLRPFAMLCGFIGEFGLFGEEQAEFERQMKLFVSMGCKSLARRMLEDPIAPSLADMGGISGAEAVALYRQIVAGYGTE